MPSLKHCSRKGEASYASCCDRTDTTAAWTHPQVPCARVPRPRRPVSARRGCAALPSGPEGEGGQKTADGPLWPLGVENALSWRARACAFSAPVVSVYPPVQRCWVRRSLPTSPRAAALLAAPPSGACG
jgi:hypothetical protein